MTRPRRVPIRAVLAVGVFLSVLAFSLFQYPYTVDHSIWMTDQKPDVLQWDTGYGFNPLQTEFNAETPAPSYIHGPHKLFLVKIFDRLHVLKALRITSSQPQLHLFLGHDREMREVPLVQGVEGDKFTYFAPNLGPQTGARSLRAWAIFALGGLLVTGLFFSLWNLLLQPALKFLKDSTPSAGENLIVPGILISGAAIALLTLYPGFINPFNALHVIQSFENYIFVPQDSTFLSLLWAALYEVVPHPYFITVVQVLFFVSGLLYAAERLRLLGWNPWLLAAIFGALAFSPLSLVYHVFLEKNVVNGYVNGLLALFAFTFFAKKSPITRSECAVFGAIMVLSVSLRQDNFPFSVGLFLGLLWRRGKDVQTIAATILGFVALAAILGAMDFASIGDWRPGYAATSTINSTIDIVASSCHGNVLTLDERAITQKVIKPEFLEGRRPFCNTLDNHNAMFKQVPAEENRAYLQVFRRLIFDHFEHFFVSRIMLFNKILKSTKSWWDIDAASGDRLTQRNLRDLRLVPAHWGEGDEYTGIRGSGALQDWAANYSPFYFTLAVLAVCLALWPLAPISAFISLCLMSRVASVFFLAPVHHRFYFYDIYLATIFLIFGLVFELKRGRGWLSARALLKLLKNA